MTDPVVLSSGVVLDISSAINEESKEIRFKQCPFTNQALKQDVYPLSCLRGRIKEWALTRFRLTIKFAELYALDEHKFNEICEVAESIMADLDEKVYRQEVKKLS